VPYQELDYRYRIFPAVIWPVIGYNQYGEPMLGGPSQIQVRWDDDRHEVMDPKGNVITLEASVILPQRVLIGSLMWRGLLSSWYGTGSALPENDVMQIIMYDETPDLKGRCFRREAHLMRYHNKIEYSQLSTSLALGSAPDPSNFNQQVTFIATLSYSVESQFVPTPSGTITFKDGATLLTTTPVTGALPNPIGATYKISTLAHGTHNISATYNGDTFYRASTSPTLAQVVN
jgi:hypothetical protein